MYSVVFLLHSDYSLERFNSSDTFFLFCLQSIYKCFRAKYAVNKYLPSHLGVTLSVCRYYFLLALCISYILLLKLVKTPGANSIIYI